MRSEIDSHLSALKDQSKTLSEHLNAVSEEIKKVEGSLATLNIGLEVKMLLSDHGQFTSEENSIFRERSVPDWQFLDAFIHEYLSWNRDEATGKFRLLYSRMLYEHRVSLDGIAHSSGFSKKPFGCGQFPDGVSFRKPLIECPLEVRVRAWLLLPSFLKEVREKIDEFVSRSLLLTEGLDQ